MIFLPFLYLTTHLALHNYISIVSPEDCFTNMTVPISTRLVTFDVTSLYANIPHDLGIKATQY